MLGFGGVSGRCVLVDPHKILSQCLHVNHHGVNIRIHGQRLAEGQFLTRDSSKTYDQQASEVLDLKRSFYFFFCFESWIIYCWP